MTYDAPRARTTKIAETTTAWATEALAAELNTDAAEADVLSVAVVLAAAASGVPVAPPVITAVPPFAPG